MIIHCKDYISYYVPQILAKQYSIVIPCNLISHNQEYLEDFFFIS